MQMKEHGLTGSDWLSPWRSTCLRSHPLLERKTQGEGQKNLGEQGGGG